jgi:UDP-glucose 4-epimerase
MPNKTILVTGGAGYIGSQTVYELLDEGYKVVVIDNLCKGHKEALPEEVSFYELDVRQVASFDQICSEHKIDGIIHFAADPAINADTADNLLPYYKNNLVGVLNVVEAMRKYAITNIVFSSTAAVYGNPDALPIQEKQSKEPLNMYGQTKLMAEKLLIDASRMWGINVTRLRYFNACGADLDGRTGENHNPETHLIPIILQVAAGHREYLSMFGNDYDTPDGTCVRDYIHTKDLASAHIKALEYMFESKEVFCQDFNVGTGNGYSNLEIVKEVEKVTDCKIKIVNADRRIGDWDSAYADNNKIKQVLNWEPKYSDLNTIIQSSWNWYQKTN